MNRWTAIVICAGAVVMSTHMLAPAGAPGTSVSSHSGSANAVDGEARGGRAPVIETIDAQVARLRQRLADRPSYPQPARDPFRFGQRPEPRATRPAEIAAPPAPAAASAPALPRLVAITAAADGAPKAVLGVDDELKVVGVGE